MSKPRPSGAVVLAIVAAGTVAWLAIMANAQSIGMYVPLALLSLGLLPAGSWALRDQLGSLLKPSARSVAIGVGSGLALYALSWVGVRFGSVLVPGIEEQFAHLYELLRQPPGPTAGLPLLVLIVAAEELVWRGVLMAWLLQRRGSLLAVVLAAFAYGLAQAGAASPVLLAVGTFCGLFWGAVRVASGDLVAPLVSHLVWNVLAFVLFPLDGA